MADKRRRVVEFETSYYRWMEKNKRIRLDLAQTSHWGWIQFYHADEEQEELQNQFPNLPTEPQEFHLLVEQGGTQLETLYFEAEDIGEELRLRIERGGTDKYKVQYKHANAEFGWTDLKKSTNFKQHVSKPLQLKLLLKE